MTLRNERTVTVKMKRIDLANLMLALTSVIYDLESIGQHSAKMWEDLHEKLKTQLQAFDEKCDEENKL